MRKAPPSAGAAAEVDDRLGGGVESRWCDQFGLYRSRIAATADQTRLPPCIRSPDWSRDARMRTARVQSSGRQRWQKGTSFGIQRISSALRMLRTEGCRRFQGAGAAGTPSAAVRDG